MMLRSLLEEVLPQIKAASGIANCLDICVDPRPPNLAFLAAEWCPPLRPGPANRIENASVAPRKFSHISRHRVVRSSAEVWRSKRYQR
jgi:hypothetical protein